MAADDIIEYPIRGGVAKIARRHLNLVSAFKWYVSPDGYAAARVPGRKFPILMHRLIKGFPCGEVHHINKGRLDNWPGNLMVMSPDSHRREHGQARRI